MPSLWEQLSAIALKFWHECVYRPATIRAVFFVLLSSILFLSVAPELVSLDPTGAILSIMLFLFIAWLGIAVASDLDNTPETKADRFLAQLTHSHRQDMAVAFASGTHRSLGKDSPLQQLSSDLVSIIMQKAYRADEVWEFQSGAMSTIFRHRLYPICVEVSYFRDSFTVLVVRGVPYLVHKEGNFSRCRRGDYLPFIEHYFPFVEHESVIFMPNTTTSGCERHISAGESTRFQRAPQWHPIALAKTGYCREMRQAEGTQDELLGAGLTRGSWTFILRQAKTGYGILGLNSDGAFCATLAANYGGAPAHPRSPAMLWLSGDGVVFSSENNRAVVVLEGREPVRMDKGRADRALSRLSTDF